RSAGSSMSAMRSVVASSSTRTPSRWSASRRRTAGSRSCVVMRTVSAIRSMMPLGLDAPQELDGVAEEGLDHLQAVLDAARPAGEVDDQRSTPEPRDAAREPRVGGGGCAVRADGLRNARRLTLEDRAGGLGRDVACGEAGAACREDDVGAVEIGPGGQRGRDALGVVRDARA